MFFGVLEPITHTLNSPMGIDPADTDTACAICMSAAIMHWGLHAWAIYAVVGLSLAFFCFNRGMQLTLRSAFFLLFSAPRSGASSVISSISLPSRRRCRNTST
jgi:BCCT family betaine/carnitine transporter